jgi:hypothetical protein
MVYKPTRHQSLAKSQGRDDPRHISTAGKARESQSVSSNSRTGSYSGREEELFTALVQKYGPEPVGPNYKSRNESKHPVVTVTRDNLQSARSWGDTSSLMPIEERRRVEARALACYLGVPDRDDVEVPLSIRLCFPVDDGSEVDNDLVDADEAFLSSQLKLFSEQAHITRQRSK